MTELKTEHVLIFAIVAFVLYHLMNRCSCFNNGFSVGGYGRRPEDYYACTDHDWHWTCKEYGKFRGCVWRDGRCFDPLDPSNPDA